MAIFSYLIFFGFIALIVYIVLRLLAKQREVRSHWHHTFDNLQFEPQELYKAITASLKAREIKDASFDFTTHNEGNFLQPYRLYLTVRRYEYVFDICAAPIGTGLFVSWWLVEEFGFFDTLMRSIPLLRKLFVVRTYYSVDNELAYRDLVHLCVQEAIETMSGTQGYRALLGEERQIPLNIPQ